MTTTLDGFIAGPDDELDWMLAAPDKAPNDDTIALLAACEAGFLGYPVAIGTGKPLFAQKTNLKLVSARTYDSGVMRLRYQPALSATEPPQPA